MAVVIQRFEVYLVTLDSKVGGDMARTRPCVIISPDEMNRHLQTVIVAPMTSQGRPYPSRVACRFQNQTGQIVLDQIRTVDKTRLVSRLGRIAPATQRAVLAVLAEMFAA